MAAVTSCNFRLPNFTAAAPLPLRRLRLKVLCAISTSSTPRKFTVRKNYLRQKLPKTITKPLSETTPEDPLIPIEIPTEKDSSLMENEASQETSQESGFNFLGKFPSFSSKQFGVVLLGACVFYAIVVALDEISSLEEDRSRKSVKKVYKNGVLEVGLGNGGVVYLDEGEMQRKIEDIRVMARAVRERERLEGGSNRDGYESDEEDEVDEVDANNKSGIEKEVTDRLVKLSKILEKNLPVESVSSLKDNVIDGGNKLGRGRGESKEALMFKKKYRFRGLSSRPVDKPKGFTGRFDEDSGGESMMNGETKKDGDVDLFEKALSKKQAMELTESSRTGDNELRKASKMNSVKVKHKRPSSEAGQMKSGSEAEPWWTSLPYVLVILMQGEGSDSSAGLFTLRNGSSAKDGLSHAVAFEDRVDASNFCYLVESFFENLEGFSAEVVPLSTKELIQRVKSQTMKVLVVKKGQLKLFAGQPLQDVEMALRSLLDQN